VWLTASYDDGLTWSSPLRVNDNPAPADAFQPTVTTAPSGTVGVTFYDRRLACPTRGTEATAAGIALDQTNPNYAATPPYGATNYCVNASVQFYSAELVPMGHNIRLSAHTCDPRLNAPHTSCPTCTTTFIGGYFGFDTAGTTAFFTSSRPTTTERTRRTISSRLSPRSRSRDRRRGGLQMMPPAAYSPRKG
jgi:hypothetical protein